MSEDPSSETKKVSDKEDEQTNKVSSNKEDEDTKPEADKKSPAPVSKAALKEKFESFAKFGDKAADGKTIKLSQSDKWFKQAKVIEPKGVTTTDTGIAFRKISKNSPKLSFLDWNKYLDEIVKTKSIDGNEMKSKLVSCEKPGFTGTTEVAKTKALDRLTDASKYGGTHRNRFSADGKGRGKEGRVDAKPAKLRE
jgi:hypothetical protein